MRNLILISTLLLASACATHFNQDTKTVTEEAKQEPELETTEQTRTRISEVIKQAPDVTPEKKAAILKIIDQLYSSNQDLHVLFNQKKVLYIKELMSPQYKENRARAIERSMKQLHQKEIQNIFNSILTMKKEIGIQSPNTYRLYERVIEMGIRR